MTAHPRGENPGSPAADPAAPPVPPDGPGAGPDAVGGSAGPDAPPPPAGTDSAEPAAEHAAEADESAAEAAEAGSPGEADGSDGTASGSDGSGGAGSDTEGGAGDGGGGAGAGVSEAEAELAAQRELRERIERRKAERGGPIASGTKLSGRAADLLAAVRAVESGEKPAVTFPESPAPVAAPRRVAPPPVAPPRAPVAPPVRAPRVAAPETVAAVRAVLAEGGAPEALAARVANALGETAGELLREDPWRLLAVPGVRPEQADGFARALLGAACVPGDARRTDALVVWLLERAALQGHTALDAAAVRAALAERSVPDPDEAVRHAVAEGAVLVFHDEDEDEGPEETDGEAEAVGADDGKSPVLLGLDRYAMAEESLADGLARLARSGPDPRWAQARPQELARAVAAQGLVVHTGGEAARAEPVALVEAARGAGLRAALAVHSENGRRRLGPEVDAVTVAALLSGAAGPGRDEDGAFALDLLVVLDAPQLDVETAAMLVESVPDGCRLVLSGDPHVLPSAGAGRVFGDLLAARVCPQVASRTPDPGPVGELVSGIGVGELLQVEAPGREVVIVPVRDAGEAVHRTVQLVADSVPRALGVPVEQTQVITVGHGGSAGTRALNAALKQRLNPGPGRFGGFDPGDRVAYAEAPGRTLQGTVVSADAQGLHLDCEGRPERVVVPKERVESLVRHGWALTAHQAAGVRWPAAVAVLPGDAVAGLSRAWVYTAFSRGERHLSVVHGADQALARAVAEPPGADRVTRLRGLLEAVPEPVEE
ncbi:helix-hairpin-helix domain-containing protein [Streptomyces thermolilacinus]|uniref:DNA helicase RecD n=1 Tax=Streptomyces thermolilacinus SPC6 TaxID=1306406 RepID=A0A1D3DX83_9ACTN|nr:helix-hairpin-helix domain-containing protein [Streptomyces thermolilacinus]OEJ96931.1 DNA helicase RecD [Streptomyces thermolilacinus SPC6]